MKQYLVLYLATLVIMTALDLTWLGVIARDFYRSRLGAMLEFHAMPALLFYLLYPLGIVFFVSHASAPAWQTLLLTGMAFGLFTYGTYDLTNLATLRDWSLSLTLVDIAWGACVTGVSAVAGRYVTNMLG